MTIAEGTRRPQTNAPGGLPMTVAASTGAEWIFLAPMVPLCPTSSEQGGGMRPIRIVWQWLNRIGIARVVRPWAGPTREIVGGRQLKTRTERLAREGCVSVCGWRTWTAAGAGLALVAVMAGPSLVSAQQTDRRAQAL